MTKMQPQQAYNEAVRMHQAGDLAGAEKRYRSILKKNRNHPDVLAMLGRLLIEQGRVQQGLSSLRKATRQAPDKAQLHKMLGVSLLQAGKEKQAIKSLERAVELDNRDASIHFEVARAYFAIYDIERMLEHLNAAVVFDPENMQYRHMLATTLARSGRFPIDTSHFEWLLERDPDNLEYRLQLGNAHRGNGELDKAEAEYRKILEVEPKNHAARVGMAEVLESRGEGDEAYKMLRACRDEGARGTQFAMALARVCKQRNTPEEAIEVLRREAEGESASRANKTSILFRLGQLYEDIDDYEQAWQAYEQANRLHASTWDGENHRETIDAVIEVYSKEDFPKLPRSGVTSEKPVFIVGMFRSGTTLLEQIVSQHTRVFGAGERTEITTFVLSLPSRIGSRKAYPHCLTELTETHVNDFATAHLAKLEKIAGGDPDRITDKLPLNYLHLGFIRLLYPNCRIIHCTRDPIDTCLSIYANAFSTANGFTTDLEELGRTYRQYQRLMAHWRDELEIPMHEVAYESLVSDQEGVSRGVIEFLGLEWEEACLDFHRSRRVALTLSEAQVRKPMYTSSVGRAERFGARLDPLRRILEGT